MSIWSSIAVTTTVTTRTNTDIVLQSPIYTEYDKTTSQKAVVVNGTTRATEVTFSGHGTAKDVNFTDSVNL